MATYIKGVTDIAPKSSPNEVDYTLLSQGLEALQGRYESAYRTWKSMHDSIINGDLSSQDNIQFRADYMKKADAYISQVAGIDLSNGNNLQQAMSIFDPLVNDEQFVTDLYKTKTQKEQINKMNNFKFSSDPKLQAQYNPIMEQYLNLGMERLSNTRRNDGSINAARVNMFASWQDPLEYANKLAKEQGLKIETNTPDGKWMVYELNGGKTVDTYRNWFRNTIGNKFDNQFRIEAEVDVENDIKAKMAQDPTLTREAVMSQMSVDFSNRYVKSYDEDISSVESQVNALNAERRRLEKKYPNPSQEIVNRNIQLKKQKDALSDQLTELKTARGTDTKAFTDKAAKMFMDNPAGIYVSDVRNRYANAFGYNQAYGTQSLKYEANQIWMHEDSQRHAWAMKAADQKFQREMKALDFQNDLTKMALKGEFASTQAIGATIGQAQDVGKLTPDALYLRTITSNLKKSTDVFVDDKVLAVAANLPIGSKGSVSTQGTNLDFSVVQTAIMKKANNQGLTAQEGAQLKSYLDMVLPTNNITNGAQVTFPQIQRIITEGVRQNKNYNTSHGSRVYEMVTNANKARYDYAQMYSKENAHLAGITDDELKQYITTNASGHKSINHAAVAKAGDAEEIQAIYSQLIPGYNSYLDRSARQMNTIVLNPSDPGKFDATLFMAAINNAEKIGVSDPSNPGSFIAMGKDELGRFRGMTTSGTNLLQVFDPKGTTYERKVIDNVEYVKVTMPMIKGSDGALVGQKMGFLSNEDMIEQNQNKVEFLVPLANAMNLAGNKVVTLNPLTMKPIVEPNNMTDLMRGLVGEDLIDDNRSWVSEGGLLTNGTSMFPDYFKTSVKNGSLYRVGDDIMLQVITDDGNSIVQNITSGTAGTGISYSDLARDPSTNDKIINKYVFDAMETVARRAMASSHTNIKTNASSTGSSGSNSGYWANNPF
jgi:hypothetical protein